MISFLSQDKENKENREMSRERSRDRLAPAAAAESLDVQTGANNSGSASDILMPDAYGQLRASQVNTPYFKHCVWLLLSCDIPVN